MLHETAAGLYCPAGDFHIDPWRPVARAVITHAHGDHARPGSAAYLCADPCAPLLRATVRARAPSIEPLPYGDALDARRRSRVSFHPAGHILGSAQVRVEGRDGVWVVVRRLQAGAPIRRARRSSRCPATPSSPSRTFALPIYRWDPTAVVIAEIMAWWDGQPRRRR